MIVATPMLVSSIIALTWTALHIAHQRTMPNFQKTLTTRERLFAGLGIPGVGLILLGVVFYLLPFYTFNHGVIMMGIGIPLLVAAFLVRRTYKTEAENR